MAMKMKKMKKNTIRRTTAPRKRVAARKSTESRIKQTWNETVEALRGSDVRGLIDREGKKGLKELQVRFASLQSLMRKERKNFSKRVDGAVQGALASFNIPSRQEVQDLTRKVNDLTRKLDSRKR